MKSWECALIWHQVWSQSLCLSHSPIHSVQLVQFTHSGLVNIPNKNTLMRNSVLTSYNQNTAHLHWYWRKDNGTRCTSLSFNKRHSKCSAGSIQNQYLFILITKYPCRCLSLPVSLNRTRGAWGRWKEKGDGGWGCYVLFLGWGDRNLFLKLKMSN